uniref:Uncharacterized protein n=1 Tax=Anguilla anguilla TaxID=7936 RepID=A0A0E9WAZ8_ANGAN
MRVHRESNRTVMSVSSSYAHKVPEGCRLELAVWQSPLFPGITQRHQSPCLPFPGAPLSASEDQY